MRFFLLLLFAFKLLLGFSQLSVSDVQSAQQAVQSLAGDGVVISNVSIFYQNSNGQNSPIGTFIDPNNTIGLSGGLLMTTGSAKLAAGANNSPSAGQQNSGYDQSSSELGKLVSGVNFRDICTVEFDISVSSDVLTFNYVFGSEEYVEYVDDGYNDVFGFFISGPGINGVRNIALVPNTNTPVSVNSINDIRNSSYFVNNGSGDIIVNGSPIQYDGYTVPLVAKAIVNPCEVYHIKLVIADVGDSIYDSGVFIEANSFSSQNVPTVEVLFEHVRFDYAIEGCNNPKIRISRGKLDMSRLNQSVEYFYQFSGSAILDEDFSSSLLGSLIIPAGEPYIDVYLDVFADDKEEIIEFVDFELTSGCANFGKKYKVTFQIYEQFSYGLYTQVACLSQEAVINLNPKYNDELYWHSDLLSCQNCTSPVVIEDSTRWYVFDATDSVSGCSTTDSVYVIVLDMKADFEINQLECTTVQDVQFSNKSKTANVFKWSFGDGGTSNEQSPAYLYGDWSASNIAATYDVILIAENTRYGCRDSVVKSIDVSEFVFVPNVITPNKDNKNDFFEIDGFLGTCWVLSIYDRWGSLVFQEQDYHNNWGGEGLPDGVYYYEISNDIEERQFKGTLLIVR
jgi:gliding motility-associated-like protein